MKLPVAFKMRCNKSYIRLEYRLTGAEPLLVLRFNILRKIQPASYFQSQAYLGLKLDLSQQSCFLDFLD